MNPWYKRLVDFLRAEDGPTAVEYAVMLSLIVVVCLVAITALGGNASATFANVSLNTAAGSSS
jgi:pilus assembly protein Flp/PilA